MSSFPCKIIEADLDADIVTLQMEGDYTVSAGQKYLCDAAPVNAEPVAHAMEAIMGYRLEFKPGEYCYYTPEGYALEAYKGDAPAHALYANPQPGCPSEVEVYKGWRWVRPKYNFGNIVDETFRPLFLGPQLGAPGAAQAQPSSDRAMLLKLMAAFDMEVWNCPNCTAAEETKDCDSAIMLREYLSNNPVIAQQPVSGAEGLPPLPRGISKHSVIGHDADVYTDVHMLDYARAALAQQDAETGKSVLVENQGVTKQDADKVQADLLSSLVEIVDAVIANDEEGLIEHSETIIKARAAIDSARKEQA